MQIRKLYRFKGSFRGSFKGSVEGSFKGSVKRSFKGCLGLRRSEKPTALRVPLRVPLRHLFGLGDPKPYRFKGCLKGSFEGRFRV